MLVKPKNANRFRHEFQLLEQPDRERVFKALKTFAETPVPQTPFAWRKTITDLKQETSGLYTS